jgi:hypothetical protein
MKGTLVKTDQGWVVEHKVAEKTPIGYKSWWGTFPLHSTDVKICIDYGDYSVDWDGKEVEFELVTEWETGEVGVNGLTYAKLINHPVDSNEVYAANNYDAWDEVIDQLGETNKMIDHIGEVNEMVDQVPDVGDMVEDDAAPIDWLINQLENHIVLSAHGKLGTNRTGDYRIGLRKAIDFCHQVKEMEAKETLYTEEQLREAMIEFQDWSFGLSADYFKEKYQSEMTEIIQSLKQPKQ